MGEIENLEKLIFTSIFFNFNGKNSLTELEVLKYLRNFPYWNECGF